MASPVHTVVRKSKTLVLVALPTQVSSFLGRGKVLQCSQGLESEY